MFSDPALVPAAVAAIRLDAHRTGMASVASPLEVEGEGIVVYHLDKDRLPACEVAAAAIDPLQSSVAHLQKACFLFSRRSRSPRRQTEEAGNIYRAGRVGLVNAVTKIYNICVI